MRENCTYSLSGGRWPACKRATSDPTPVKLVRNEWREGPLLSLSERKPFKDSSETLHHLSHAVVRGRKDRRSFTEGTYCRWRIRGHWCTVGRRCLDLWPYDHAAAFR